MRQAIFPLSGKANRTLPFLLALLLSAQTLSGCAARPPAELDGQEKYYIAGVPFYRFAQQKSSCGTAALACVLSFWDQRISMQNIASRVRLPKADSSLPLDMQRFLSQEGFVTVSTTGSINDLKAQVRRNVPVISMLDPGFGPYHRPHYVTVIGFDDAAGAFIIHDGLTANKNMAYGAFMESWERAGNWMLVAVPGSEWGRQTR